LQPKIKKDNLLVNEGWAQYFSFRVLDHLMEKTNFFDEHKPEICEVSKKYLDLVKEDLSIYGQSYTFFETREDRGETPIELAGKIGIKQGLYSTLY
jgi:hypothetical protein